MNRAIPASFLLHMLLLMLAILFGAHVSKRIVPRQRTIAIRTVVLPHPEKQAPAIAPQEKTPPPPEETKPAVLPPEMAKQTEKKPEPKPQEKQPESEKKPVEKPEEQDEKQPPAETPANADAALGQSPAASHLGTDVEVPARFQYWLDLLEQRIAAGWHPTRLGFRSDAATVCRIHFSVEQDGRISRETVASSSGVALMDREALKAVQSVGRFLPIPRGMADGSIGITYIFTLTSGM